MTMKFCFAISVPPSKLTILNDLGEAITRPMVGPYSEGASVRVTCLASGGLPPPRVTWWSDSVLVDDSDHIEPGDRVRNELMLDQLDRGHAGLVYTCQAINNEIVSPVSTDVRIDMYRKFVLFIIE